MLEAGWLAVRDLEGNVTHWQDPYVPEHRYPDWEAAIIYGVGDWPSTPRVRRPLEIEEAA